MLPRDTSEVAWWVWYGIAESIVAQGFALEKLIAVLQELKAPSGHVVARVQLWQDVIGRCWILQKRLLQHHDL